MKNKRFKSVKSSQKGFALVSLITFIPFLIILSFFLFLFIQGIHERTKTFSLCYRSGAVIQKKMQTQIRQLVALNKMAAFLHFQRKFSEHAIEAAQLFPLALPPLYAQLNLVIAAQQTLSKKQKIILKTGEQIFNAEIRKLKFKFMKIGYSVRYENKNPMALKKVPAQSKSPSYVPMDNFSEKQKIKIKWKMNPSKNLSAHIKNMFNLNRKKQFECSVSLNSLKNFFSIKLMKDGGIL